VTAAQLLSDLRDRGVELTSAGGKLRYGAPPGALTDDLRAAMQAHKAELLVLLELEVGTGESPPTVATEKAPPAPRLRGEVGTGETLRIPLDDLVYGDFLARHKLRIVDGTAHPDGRSYRPTIYLADDAG
jgi:hypothetical protein